MCLSKWLIKINKNDKKRIFLIFIETCILYTEMLTFFSLNNDI